MSGIINSDINSIYEPKLDEHVQRWKKAVRHYHRQPRGVQRRLKKRQKEHGPKKVQQQQYTQPGTAESDPPETTGGAREGPKPREGLRLRRRPKPIRGLNRNMSQEETIIGIIRIQTGRDSLP
ncbi:unnamed protein product [Ectocarpus sp. 4 AP-2014]